MSMTQHNSAIGNPDVKILFPAENQAVEINEDGTVPISVRATHGASAADRVFAYVAPAGKSLAGQGSGIELKPSVGDPTIFEGEIPFATSDTSSEDHNNNHAVAWGEFGHDLKASCERKFHGVCEQIDVDAGACLWFLWADGVKPGPGGENVEAHRPRKVRVPERAKGMTAEIRCVSGEWQYAKEDNASKSDASGHAHANVTEPYYRSAEYNSEHIVGIKANLSTLVALFDMGPKTTTEMIAIGNGPVRVEVPSEAKHLVFGFHDRMNWDNNSGSVKVVIRWAVKSGV